MKTRRLSGILAIVIAVTCTMAGCAKKEVTTDTGDGGKLVFSLSLPDSGNQYVIRSSDINEDEWVNKFNEKFNTDITLIYRDSKRDNEEMQMMFAAGEIPDVIVAYGDCRTKLYAEAIESIIK